VTGFARRTGLIGASVAGLGAAIAAYLSIVKVVGVPPACGPLHGCETVATSAYSAVLGVPVAAFGFVLSSLIAALQIAWWRSGDRRLLLLAYGLGLAAFVVVGYLTYLELFVIGAICVWCVGYAVTVVVGWLIAALALREA
jgi:uncharacterized membrane protein